MLKPAQEMEARLDQGTAPDVEQTAAVRSAAKTPASCDGENRQKGSKLFETSLLFASGLLLLLWTFVLGWLAVELVSWLRG